MLDMFKDNKIDRVKLQETATRNLYNGIFLALFIPNWSNFRGVQSSEKCLGLLHVQTEYFHIQSLTLLCSSLGSAVILSQYELQLV